MKTTYLVGVFLILIGLGCNDTNKEIIEKNLIGIWELTQIEEQDENGNWTQIKVHNGFESGWNCLVNLEFKNDGRFYSNTCSNEISGNYYICQSDDRINTNSVGGTKVGEDEWGNKYYWGYLINFESYSILSDTLTISGDKFKIIFKSSSQSEN